MGWPDQGLAFDTAVHFGTLLAVIVFFRHDLISLCRASARHIKGSPSDESRFAINLIIASLPIIPVGFYLQDLVKTDFRNVNIIIATTVFFGGLLFVADKVGRHKNLDRTLNWRHAITIGIAQSIAIIPGTSRSGITMTMALLLGYSRESATRISFLLAIPAIGGASALQTYNLIQSAAPIDWPSLVIGMILSFATAYLCIRLFLSFIKRIGFTPFVLYRLTLGIVLFWFVF